MDAVATQMRIVKAELDRLNILVRGRFLNENHVDEANLILDKAKFMHQAVIGSKVFDGGDNDATEL